MNFSTEQGDEEDNEFYPMLYKFKPKLFNFYNNRGLMNRPGDVFLFLHIYKCCIVW